MSTKSTSKSAVIQTRPLKIEIKSFKIPPLFGSKNRRRRPNNCVTKMIQEYYREMRKFGCNILAVVQQYDIIKDSAVRGAMIGNSKILLH